MDIGGVEHSITVTEPKGKGTPNFITRCSCGRFWNVASTDKQFAEDIGVRHLDSETEAFEDSLDDSEEDVPDEDFDSPRSIFGDPDYQRDVRDDQERGLL